MSEPPSIQRSKKKHSKKDKQKTERKSTEVEDEKNQVEEKKPLKLNEFLELYSTSLPLKIEIETGYFGETSRQTLSAQDSFYIHYSKCCSVVTAKRPNRADFNIPLNSDITFSILYDPYDNLDEAVKGFDFPKVSDIITLENLPKVICCTCEWKDGTISLGKGEILVVLEVVKGLKTNIWLQVFSLQTNTNKLLPMECEAHFSTNPYCIPLHLLEIYNCVPNAFPCKVRVNKADSSKESLRNLPSSLVFTLLKKTSEVTLVASSTTAKSSYIEIPSSLSSVEVSVMDIDEEERQKLLLTTREIVESFNPEKIMSFNPIGKYEGFRQAVRKGHEMTGVEITVSSAIYDVPRKNPIPISMPLSPPAAPPIEHDYEQLTHVGQDKDEPTSHYDNHSLQSSSGTFKPPSAAPKPLPRSKGLNTGIYEPVSLLPTATKPASVQVLPSESPIPLQALKPPVQRSPAATPPSVQRAVALPPVAKKPIMSPPPTQSGPVLTKRTPVPLPAQRRAVAGVASKETSPPVPQSPVLTKGTTTAVPAQASTAGAVVKEASPMMQHNSIEELASPSNVKLISEDVNTLKKEVADLRGAMEQMIRSMEQLSRLQQDGTAVNGVAAQAPKSSVGKKLSVEQVCNILETKGLQQYREVFEREHIDGEISQELDDEILEKELGVTSKLHRIRIMNAFSGTL